MQTLTFQWTLQHKNYGNEFRGWGGTAFKRKMCLTLTTCSISTNLLANYTCEKVCFSFRYCCGVMNFTIDNICFSCRWISTVQLWTWIETRCNKIERASRRWREAFCCDQACRENWLNRTGQISVRDQWESGSLNTTQYRRQYLRWWVTDAIILLSPHIGPQALV